MMGAGDGLSEKARARAYAEKVLREEQEAEDARVFAERVLGESKEEQVGQAGVLGDGSVSKVARCRWCGGELELRSVRRHEGVIACVGNPVLVLLVLWLLLLGGNGVGALKSGEGQLVVGGLFAGFVWMGFVAWPKRRVWVCRCCGVEGGG